MKTYTYPNRLLLILGLTLATLAILATACSPASDPSSATAPEQAPGGLLLQDAPPTPVLKAVEVNTDQLAPLDLGQQTLQGCPQVESQLGQILQAPNPLDTAQQLGLRVQGDKVQVLLVLNDKDIAFLEDYEVEVGKQSGTQVQAFVPFSRVCELASTENVLAIRLPGQAVVQ